MIPNNALSSLPVIAPFLERVNDPKVPLVDYEMGGAALNDPSQGLRVKTWEAYVAGNTVYIKADDVPATALFSASNIQEISLAFDQNMNPAIAYLQGGVAYLWWYDATVPGYATLTFPDATTPRVTLDDKRPVLINSSDIILAYVKNNHLYFRAQRDRFTVEYLLKTDVNARLISIGMARNYRLKFKLETISG